MQLLKSTALLVLGISKNFFGWIGYCFVIIQILESLGVITLGVPSWFLWLIIGIALFLACLQTYHRLRMQKIALEAPPSWIDEYKERYGRLPELPSELKDFVHDYVSGPINHNIQVGYPSMQKWARMLPSQKRKLKELLLWKGLDPEDYLKEMEIRRPPGRGQPLQW